MEKTSKRLAAVVIVAVLAVLGASQAAHAARADGVCGGVGTHFDPATGQCL